MTAVEIWVVETMIFPILPVDFLVGIPVGWAAMAGAYEINRIIDYPGRTPDGFTGGVPEKLSGPQQTWPMSWVKTMEIHRGKMGKYGNQMFSTNFWG